MDLNKSEQKLFSSKDGCKTIPLSSITASTTEQSNNIRFRRRIFENFLLIWLYLDIDEASNDYRDAMAQFRTIINNIETFTDPEKCLDFLTGINDEKVFMIISGTHSEQILSVIHDVQQLDAIYLFYHNSYGYEQSVKEGSKVKGIHTEITSLYKAIQNDLKQFNQDSISISFVPIIGNISNQNLNQLEPLFMYTQMLKEILLEMEYDEESIKELILYWRSQYAHNDRQLNIIAEFERDYTPQSSIWWYTRTYFTYHVLNHALRNLEAEAIIKMSFFIRDLHRQIQELHAQQFGSLQIERFTVYRGQGLSILDFEKLRNTKNGLMSFNNFLSTSKEKEVSILFAEGGLTKSGSVGILFEMTIDPSISTAAFALIDHVSYFKTEQEILFSMHTVFRIGEIKKLDDDKQLYQVELTLTNDDDEQLHTLSERIRQEAKGSNGWERLGDFLITLSQFDMAEQLHNALFDQESDDRKKAKIYNQLGHIKHGQGDFKEALSYYKQAIESFETNVSSNDLDLAAFFNNIGSVYMNMAEYSTALSFHKKALEVFEKALPLDHPDLAASFHNIGKVYDQIGEYAEALSFYKKALTIRQKILPSNHPKLAVSYSNLGAMYENMRQYSEALLFYKKAADIRQKSLPPNHPDLAISYNSIGRMYRKMEEYSRALFFHEKAHGILEETLPSNHPNLATSYNNIGGVYDKMGEYRKALMFHEKAFEIQQKSLSLNHPDVAASWNNIATVYYAMDEYSRALMYHEKALEIYQKTLPSNHPALATCRNNIGRVYAKMGEYRKALIFHEKALEIRQQTLPPNHPDMAVCWSNMGAVYYAMGEYSRALTCHEKALEIYQKTLPSNHPDLATCYNNVGLVYNNTGGYSKAISYYTLAIDIMQRSLPSNHPQLDSYRKHLETVKKKLQE